MASAYHKELTSKRRDAKNKAKAKDRVTKKESKWN